MASFIDEGYIKQLSHYADRFTECGNGTYNIRCPICGDSQKSEYKARGYFYLSEKDRWRYKCFNCAANEHFSKILKLLAPHLYEEYRLDVIKELKEDTLSYKRQIEQKNNIKVVKNSTYKALSDTILGEFDPILPSKTPDAYKYLKERCIPLQKMSKLFYVKSLKNAVRHLKQYDLSKVVDMSAIVIPYYDDDNLLTGFQIRNLDKKSKLRYLTYDVQKDPVYIYNLTKIISTEPVYVFEGAFDSMFCKNGAAASGSSIFSKLSKIKERCDKIVVAFDNDYKTNKEIYDLLLEVIDAGYSVVLYDSKMDGYKDINAFVEKNPDAVKGIDEYLRSCTYSPLAAKLFLADVKKTKGNLSWAENSSSTQATSHKKINKSSPLQVKRSSPFMI